MAVARYVVAPLQPLVLTGLIHNSCYRRCLGVVGLHCLPPLPFRLCWWSLSVSIIKDALRDTQRSYLGFRV